jgi:hypothetical protein
MSGEDSQPGEDPQPGDTVEPETVVRDPEEAERTRRARATAAAEAARKRRGEDTLDPRRPPPNATIYRESRRHSGLEFDDPAPAKSGRALWQRLLALLALLVVIGAGVVLISLGGSSGHHRARHKKPVAAAKAKHPATTTTSATATWPRYTTAAYTASYPPGWTVAENNAPISGGAYYETRFVSPGGGTLIDIDRTPSDPDSAQQAAKSVAAASSGEAGYRQLAFTALTLAGAPAWKWAFLAPASGRITLSGYHDDLFRRIDGGRYATLGVGGGRGATSRRTERVATSITAH